MNLIRNIKVGLIKILFLLSLISSGNSENLEGNFTEIKILNKISSKNVSLELKNNEEKIFDDLIIKSIKCKNSEFDDDPEIISYIQGYKVTPYYDSMICKLICHGRNREEAIQRMNRSLDEFVIEGITTTIPLHKKLLNHKKFLESNYNVSWLDNEKVI